MAGGERRSISWAHSGPLLRRVGFSLTLFLLLALLGRTILMAQERSLQRESGAIGGVVIDAESGEALADVYVSVQNHETRASTTSDDDGSFLFSQLVLGQYSVHVSHLGYKSLVIDIDLDTPDEHDVIVYLEPLIFKLDPVVISQCHAHSAFEDKHDKKTLQGKDLQKELGFTLASTLKSEAGLAVRSMGPAPARPVIRGLGGNRVQFNEDGMKTTDMSATSPDHAVTIEPFSLDKIEVIRGPKVLLWNSTSVGGVVNAVRHEIPFDKRSRTFVSLGAYGETANKGRIVSGIVEAPVGDFVLRGEASARETDDLRTPTGVLENSSSENLNYSAGGSWIPESGVLGASLRNFELAYGIPGGFVGAHPDGVNIEMQRRQINLRGSANIEQSFLSRIDGHISRAYYRHKEFEAGGMLGAEFRILNYFGYLNAEHAGRGSLKNGTAGVAFEYRDFDVGGFVFTAPSTSLNVAPYLYEEMELGDVNLEFSARCRYDRIVPDRENPEASIGPVLQRQFLTWSASASAMYELFGDVFTGMNLSRTSRTPTIEELYSEGPHLAAYSYEVGNPLLESEYGWGVELFMHFHASRMKGLINVFRNDITNFITPRNTGEIDYSTFLPIYASMGIPALMYGAEAELEWTVIDALMLHATLSYTHGSFSDSGNPLPQIPPMKLITGLTWTAGRLSAGAAIEAAAAQERVDEFEQPTAGYAVFSMFGQYSFTFGTTIHNLSLSLDNIFDTEYRNHLSRVKSIMPEAGHSLRLTYKMFFEL